MWGKAALLCLYCTFDAYTRLLTLCATKLELEMRAWSVAPLLGAGDNSAWIRPPRAGTSRRGGSTHLDRHKSIPYRWHSRIQHLAVL